ncbi:MAG: (2Fe-2S) ferredoxin domain-containing protein [Rhizonema sp. PD38]|nr:(2Fe-2S) ferredoxin domain-containing protein [Rhizonema sp. PD38]
MSKSYSTEISEFCLEGRFLNFVIKDSYKLKGLMLSTSEGERYIKLAKHLRATFDWQLPPGTWLQVAGEKESDRKTGEVKLKAERVMAARIEEKLLERESVGENSLHNSPDIPIEPKRRKGKTAILVCQKSDCMKRGGKALCHALEKALGDRDLDSQITIQGTGCMKNCKAGPNLVMPDKTRYSRIQAEQVPTLIEKHFASHSTEL